MRTGPTARATQACARPSTGSGTPGAPGRWVRTAGAPLTLRPAFRGAAAQPGAPTTTRASAPTSPATAAPSTVGRPIDAEPVEIAPGTEVAAATSAPDGSIELRCRQTDLGTEHTIRTDAVVLATGYRAVRPAALDPIAHLIDWDEQGRYRVDLDHRVATVPALTGGLYVQNAELHTHGVGTPDLGLGAHRAAVILNAVAGRAVHPLPARTAWTSFTASAPGSPQPRATGHAPARAR